MSFGRRSQASQATVLAGVQIQTSCYGGPIPIIYGTSKVTGNFIWFNGFNRAAVKTSTGGCGGDVTTGYNYTASWISALCEGPIIGVNTVWSYGNVGTLASGGLTLLTGTRPQSPWSYVTSNYPSQAVSYNGFAQIGAINNALNGDATFPQVYYEVLGFFASAGTGGVQDLQYTYAYDVRPCDALLDVLTNPIYGCGWNSSAIASMTSGSSSYATYCTAVGIVISWVINSQKSAAEHIKDIMDCTNSDIVQTCDINGNALLAVIPYGDTVVGSYTPNTTPLYSFTADNFLGVVSADGKVTGDDAVKVTRTNLADVYNTVPVEFLDRHALNVDGTNNGYATSIVQSPEPTDSAVRGMVIDSAKSLHMITSSSVALHVSLILAQRNVYIRNTYTFRVGWQFVLLDPMDLVQLSDPMQGLVNKVVRIVSIDYPEEGSEDQGMEIVAEEWPFGTAHAALYNVASSAGQAINTAAAPGNATALIFDAPSVITSSGGYEICIALAGGVDWGGADIWASYDNTTFNFIGTVTGPARFGTLSASLPAYGGTNPDTVDTLAVTGMTGALDSVTAAMAADATNLCWCDGELVSYTTATLTGSNAYNLTSLYRGLDGSTGSSHSSGANFCRFDDTVFQYPVPASRVGQTIYFKFLSFNLWGGAEQTLSGVSSVSHTIGSPVYPEPYGVTLTITTTQPSPP